ncbi:hypothetical protein [Streptomyces sp. NPDC006551]|uniref:hypothetical protein n=1 Tax=Streptomyces sp. NPDC006551 TaxID=3157178 RepID=UPI0033A72EFB
MPILEVARKSDDPSKVMSMSSPYFKFGEPIPRDTEGVVDTPPPIVFHVQSDARRLVTGPEELKEWEDSYRKTTGIKVDSETPLSRMASESLSHGIWDDSITDPDMCT